MDLPDDCNRRRIVGDYIIGRRIGSGSFAVVWKSRHRYRNTEFAIKEIEKKHLNDNLLKEISILRNINHPNIIRLYETIQTEDRIYLVLEYCDGGDLGAYINRHGRVTEDIARHFMKQLAAGLQVLHENHLIHRDLKPQNLLLTSKELTPSLKIGDFGFARYLTPQGLADTLCGSPLYMAPEIIQNQKYDAKADLWSVGAILFQLVVGRPPFYGNSQLELFNNILTTSELRFPDGALAMLQSDFVHLCRCLLRRNPIERLTFGEFFNHQFLAEPRFRYIEYAEHSDLTPQVEFSVEKSECIMDRQCPQLASVNRVSQLNLSSINEEKIMCSEKFHEHIHTTSDQLRIPVGVEPTTSNQSRGAGSVDSIEKGYVFVHSHFASTETLTSSLERTLLDSSTSIATTSGKKTDQHVPVEEKTKDHPLSNISGISNASSCIFGSRTMLGSAHILMGSPGLSILHFSTRLLLLDQYVRSLSDLAQEKFNAGLFLESVSVEFVVLALWEEAIRICNSWLASTGGYDAAGVPSDNSHGSATLSLNPEDNINFIEPSAAAAWAEYGFIVACERAEKLQKYLQDSHGTEMPDAMEIIYQTALDSGRNGGAHEYKEKWDSAARLYSKAMLLLSFIMTQAPSLALNPPFVLAPGNKVRIQRYIKRLQPHWSRCKMSKPTTPGPPSVSTRNK